MARLVSCDEAFKLKVTDMRLQHYKHAKLIRIGVGLWALRECWVISLNTL